MQAGAEKCYTLPSNTMAGPKRSRALSLRRLPFYYGWVIVAVIALTSIAETAEFHPTLGAFIKPLEEEFGWSRTAFTGAISLGTILGGLTALVIGPLLDRFGPRWILFTGFLILGGTIMSLSLVHALWQFYLVMIVGRVIIQGAIGIAVNVTVAKWFVRQRGRAIALANLGVRFGNALTPAYVQWFITNYGWRTASVALGLFTWALTLVPTLLFLRRQPEDMGLRPDGDPEDAEGPAPREAAPRRGPALTRDLTLAEVMRLPSFYLVLFATCGSFFVGAGINLHILPLLSDRGLSPGQAVSVVSIWSLMGALGTLAGGLAAEKVPVRFLLGGSYLLLAGVVAFLLAVDSYPEAVIFAVLFGLAFSAVPTLQNVVFADYFGRAHLGAIRGFATPFQMVFNAAGPLAAAVLFDLTQGYTLILTAFAAAYALASVAMLASRPAASVAAGVGLAR
jgi:OFA family oxalate/formate antiporter-like MFS transporter